MEIYICLENETGKRDRYRGKKVTGFFNHVVVVDFYGGCRKEKKGASGGGDGDVCPLRRRARL